jgi:hypothetical protein
LRPDGDACIASAKIMTSGPHLHAVVAAPAHVPAFVGRVGAPPWPDFVRLFEGTSDDEVALLVAQLAGYGHAGAGATDLASLVRAFPHVTPGGLAATDEIHEVRPSCCCGLEGWRDWDRLVVTGASPWLGHDPSPWAEVSGDEFLVWPNGGLGEALSDDIQPVRFSRKELVAALTQVEEDLRSFASRLHAWATQVSPQDAYSLANQFCKLARIAR